MGDSVKEIKKRGILSALLGGYLLATGLFAAPVAVQSYVPQTDGVLFTMATGQMRLKACTGSIIRVIYSPTASFSTRAGLMVSDTFPVTPAWSIDSTASTVTVKVANLQAVVTKATGAVNFLNTAGVTLFGENPDTGKISSISSVDATGYTVDLAFNITTGENIFGLGHFQSGSNFGATGNNAQPVAKNGNYSTLNRNTNGMVVRMMVANRDKPIPFLVSTNQYGLLWDNYSDTYFSFLGATARTMSVRSTVADQIDYYVVYGAVLDSVISGYRVITGAAPLFPKAAYGFWHSWNAGTGASQANFLQNFTQFRTHNPPIPVDVVVQDWFSWNATSTNDGNWNSLIWSPTRFPAPATMIDSVHNMHMHYAVSVWPTLGTITGIYADFKNRGWTWPLHYEYGNAYVYDAYNPSARNLLWNYMNTGVSTDAGSNGYFNKGVDVWWFDGSEPETGNSQGETQSNLYGAITGQQGQGSGPGGGNYLGSFYRYCGDGFSLCHSSGVYTNQRATTSAKRVCILTRSVYAGAQRYAAISWGGDEQCTWGQVRNDPLWGMSFCAAGDPYWTFDVGAFYSGSGYPAQISSTFNYTDESFRIGFARWYEEATFMPIMRVHGDQNSAMRFMWVFQPYDATDSTFSAQYKFDLLRYRLMPYIYSLAWMVTSKGYTILRTLAFDFMNDATVLSANPYTGTEWMFGPDFLVCPISESGTGTLSRGVYLPGGSGTTWYDFWTGNQYAGSTITASASITSMPLYIRAGSILPMGPNIQYADQKQPDTIALRIYRGASGQFTLYEDEGDNYDYETGAYATIPITYNDASKMVTIGTRSGSFTGMLQTRIFKIVWVRSGHGTGLDSSVTIAPTDSDKYVTYSGSPISITTLGEVSILHSASPLIAPALSMSFKTAESIIIFPHAFAGRTKSVEIYNLNGMLLKRTVTAAGSIDLRKDFGESMGAHIVKIKTLP